MHGQSHEKTALKSPKPHRRVGCGGDNLVRRACRGIGVFLGTNRRTSLKSPVLLNSYGLGLPGRGKSHFLAALGRELILRHKYAVLFTPTFKLVQQLLAAKRDLRLEELLRQLDRFDAVILDDLGYVKQDREEMEVLFTFLAERYERRSVLLSSNLVFSKWDQIFKDPMTTMAAIDRLVHHAIILEFNGESMRVPRDREKEKSAE